MRGRAAGNILGCGLFHLAHAEGGSLFIAEVGADYWPRGSLPAVALAALVLASKRGAVCCVPCGIRRSTIAPKGDGASRGCRCVARNRHEGPALQASSLNLLVGDVLRSGSALLSQRRLPCQLDSAVAPPTAEEMDAWESGEPIGTSEISLQDRLARQGDLVANRSGRKKRMRGDLIPPHGGTLVDLLMDAEQAAQLQAESRDWPSWSLTPRQLCDLELLLTGSFSPLRGFMCRNGYERVCASIGLFMAGRAAVEWKAEQDNRNAHTEKGTSWSGGCSGAG